MTDKPKEYRDMEAALEAANKRVDQGETWLTFEEIPKRGGKTAWIIVTVPLHDRIYTPEAAGLDPSYPVISE